MKSSGETVACSLKRTRSIMMKPTVDITRMKNTHTCSQPDHASVIISHREFLKSFCRS